MAQRASSTRDPLRYAYVKNGDSVAQVSQILGTGQGVAAVASGPEAFVADLLAALENCPTLVLSRYRSSARFSAGRTTARVINGGVSGASKALRKPFAFFWIIWQLLRFGPDRIICGCVGSRLWASVIAARLLRVPIVYSGHNRIRDPSDGWFRGLKARIDLAMLHQVDGAVCHGPYLKDELDRMQLPGVAQVLEFDVALDDVAANRATGPAGPGAAVRLLFVGRLEREKGVFDLVNACRPQLEADAHGLASGQDLILDFIGGGRSEAELARQIEAAGLGERVRLHGRLPHDEVLSLMARATAVVTPSQPEFPEGRCMVAMEALALGVPVVAPDYGPFPFLVRDGDNGLLYRAGDVDALRQALDVVCRQPDRVAQLRQGAWRSSDRLRFPERTFSHAVDEAFAAADRAATLLRNG